MNKLNINDEEIKINDMILYSYYYYMGIGRVAVRYPMIIIELITIIDIASQKDVKNIGWAKEDVEFFIDAPFNNPAQYLYMDYKNISLLNDRI